MKNLFKLFILLMTLLPGAAGAASLHIDDLTVAPGGSATAAVLLDNGDAQVAALQFDLHIPQGLTVGESDVKLGTRSTASHQLMTKVNGDHLTVMVFSFPATAFSGTSGEVLTLEVHAADDFSGQTQIAVKNVALTTVDAKELAHSDFSATVTAQGFIVVGNEFYMNDFAIAPGKSARVPVIMDNKASDVAGFQFELTLPAGISATAASFEFSDRASAAHSLVAKAAGNTWKVVAFSYPTTAFTGDEGEILWVTLTAAKAFTGEAKLHFANVVMASPDARESTVEDFDVTVTADGTYTPGDYLVINDFAIKPGRKKAVDIILQNEVTQFSALAVNLTMPGELTADLSSFAFTDRAGSHKLNAEEEDGVIMLWNNDYPNQVFSGTDGALITFSVTASREFVGETTIKVGGIELYEPNGDYTPLPDFDVTVTADGEYEPMNLLYIEDFEITPGQTLNVPVILDNEASDIAALQMRLAFPEGLTATAAGVTLTSRKSDSHQVVASVKDNTLSIAAFSFPPANFSGNSGAVLNVAVTAARDFEGTRVINVSDVVLTTADAVETLIDDFNVNATANGVYVPSDNLTVTDFEIAPGRGKQVPVVLTNETARVVAVSFDLDVPDELTLSNTARLGERANGHYALLAPTADGTTHVAMSANPAAPFTGTDGNIMYLRFNASREFAGTTVVGVKNVILTTDEGEELAINDFGVIVTALGEYTPVDTLYIDDFGIAAGATLPVPVIMDNEITNVSALQFDLTMPAELTVPQAVNGDYSIALTDRMGDNHYVIANERGGAIRVVAVSFPPLDFAGNSGAVMNIDMKAADNFAGTTSFTVSNVVMTTADAKKEISVPDFVVVVNSVKGSTFIIGDVNCDGSVNAADVTALYNYILNGDTTFIATSDVNGDGAINAGDVTAVYNIILGL